MKYSMFLLVFVGCGVAPAEPCTVINNADNTYTLSCPDGSEVTLRDGEKGDQGLAGVDGSSCTVVDNGNTKTILCNDGSSVEVSVYETYTLEGTYLVTDSAGLALLNLFDTVNGDLIITGEMQVAVLPNLKIIAGQLFIADSQLLNIEMENLESIGDSLTVNSNVGLQSILMGQLVSVEGSFNVVGNDVLPECAVDQIYAQLQNHQGTVDISNNNTTAVCN